MERYYTIPDGNRPGNDAGGGRHSLDLFYGLSFVRVAFNYGVDYYLAYTQAAINLQQRVALLTTCRRRSRDRAWWARSSATIGWAPHFGLTKSSHAEDWVVRTRLLAVPGVVQVVTWGGTTKTYGCRDQSSQAGRLQHHAAASARRDRQRQYQRRWQNDQCRPAVGEHPRLGLIQRIGDIEKHRLTSQPAWDSDPAEGRRKGVDRISAQARKAGRDGEDDVVTGIVIMHRTRRTNEVWFASRRKSRKSTTTAPCRRVCTPFRITTGDAPLGHDPNGAAQSSVRVLLVFLIQWGLPR